MLLGLKCVDLGAQIAGSVSLIVAMKEILSSSQPARAPLSPSGAAADQIIMETKTKDENCATIRKGSINDWNDLDCKKSKHHWGSLSAICEIQ